MNYGQLWEIQKLDSKQSLLEKQLKGDKAVKSLKEIKQKIINLQERFKNMKRDHENMKVKGKIFEQQMAQLREEIELVSKKLYEVQNTNFKELSVQTKQLEKLNKQLGEVEEKYLIYLEQKDIIKGEYTKLTEEIRNLQEQFKSLHKAYENDRASIKSALAEIPSKRLELVKTVEEKLWSKYLELRKKYPDPLAIVHEGICSGCHIGLSTEIIKNLNRETVYCSYCGRMLFTMENLNS